MKISARDIDHLSLTLSDPETAANKLGQLGFNLTPEGVEPRCICFQPDQDDVPNYIELLQGDPPSIALAVNVAVVAPTAPGHLRLFSADELRPETTVVNFSAGQTRASHAIVRLGAAGDLSVYCGMASGSVHFVLDVAGYFE